jgi:ABC-type dipeptide/oligopeptide/nickel transport system ATPase component
MGSPPSLTCITQASALSLNLNEVLTIKDLINELIFKGKDQAARYSWKQTAEQTLEVYQQVLIDQ